MVDCCLFIFIRQHFFFSANKVAYHLVWFQPPSIFYPASTFWNQLRAHYHLFCFLFKISTAIFRLFFNLVGCFPWRLNLQFHWIFQGKIPCKLRYNKLQYALSVTQNNNNPGSRSSLIYVIFSVTEVSSCPSVY